MIQETHSLTEAQVQHFETFGFIVRRQVFSPDEIDRIDKEFDKYLAAIKEEFEKKTDPSTRRWPNWSNMNPDTPYMASLLEDPRIYVPTEQLQEKTRFLCIPMPTALDLTATGIRIHGNVICLCLKISSICNLRPVTTDLCV